ncbi:MAG: hypothetical protein RLZZ488_774 [Pseudomonadota bacterium]|jgi:hypothetical protein
MKILLALPVLIFANGCSVKESSDSSAGSSTTVLEGTWSTGCVSADGPSSKRVITVKGNTISQTFNGFSDASCASDLVQARQEATFTLGAAATAPAGAAKIDIANSKEFLTPKSDVYVNSLNTSPGFGNYGKSDWALNVEVEITGKKDDGSAEPETTEFNIYSVSGTTLCLGKTSDTNDGKSDAKRPTTLATGVECLTKQ